jgi:hypothetical protein
MIPHLYFLNESNIFVAAAAGAWSMFAGTVLRICLLFIILFLLCLPIPTGRNYRILTRDYSVGHYILQMTGLECMVQPLLSVISKVMWLPYPAESEECHFHPDT